ncbi:GFA family protein [Maritalea mediterranea]|uniref:GFA family protein n=1 Tax=Maritalea mediterranea TaxID=2909667 RepID=A0ABS9E7F0_9HYPH|nr:GFA family protein [Maritalea mediterranea]MCF4098781.1 GFA family protein [Maritalea mediterranea]
MMKEADIRAECACGQAKLTLSGPPKTTMLCACKDCQKSTGTDHAALAIWPEDRLQFEGETTHFDTTADSGATVHRHRCTRCGTPVYGISTRLKGHRLIPLGLLGEAANQFAPKSMIFARSKYEWDHTSDGLAQYATYRDS